LVYHKQEQFGKDLLKHIIRQSLIDASFDYEAYVSEHSATKEDFSVIIDEVLEGKTDIIEKIKN